MGAPPATEAAMSTPLHKAGNQMDVWKQRETLRFMVALVHHALAGINHHPSSIDHSAFASDCVPEAEQAADSHITGWAFKKLQDAHVIQPAYLIVNGVRQLDEKGNPYIRRRPSTRPGRNQAFVNLWQFTSRAAAEEFLRRNEPLAVSDVGRVPSRGGWPVDASAQSDLFALSGQHDNSPP